MNRAKLCHHLLLIQQWIYEEVRKDIKALIKPLLARLEKVNRFGVPSESVVRA